MAVQAGRHVETRAAELGTAPSSGDEASHDRAPGDTAANGRFPVGEALGYATSVLAPFVLILLFHHPWSKPAGILTGPGMDMAWMQASFQAMGQAGPFGVDEHLAYPEGFSAWSNPVFGVFASVLGWISVGLAGFSPVTSLMLFAAVCGGLNGASGYYFMRGVVPRGSTVLVTAFAVAIGANAFVLTRLAHANLLTFFVIPVAFGAVLRLARASRSARVLPTAAGVFLVAAVVGMWWVLVALAIMLVAAVPFLVRREWLTVRAFMWVVGALVLGLVVQAVLTVVAAVPGASGRLPWESNTFGGHLVDVLVSSPAVNATGLTGPLLQGASTELAFVGLVLAVAAAVTVFVVVAMIGRSGSAAILSALSLVTLLFFIAGGLGNAQAGLAVLVADGSPARAWARLLLVLGVLGLAWILLASQRRAAWLDVPVGRGRVTRSSLVGSLALVLVITAYVADAAPVARPASLTMAARPDLGFIRDRLDPCPVLQLPANGIRTPDKLPQDAGAGFVPYLMLPDYIWSYGYTERPTQVWAAGLPPRIGAGEIPAIRSKGFCAILLDRKLAERLIQQGRILPGLDLQGLSPAYSDDRYSVFVL